MPAQYPNQLNAALQHPELATAFRSHLQNDINEIGNADHVKFRDAASAFKAQASQPPPVQPPAPGQRTPLQALQERFSEILSNELSGVQISDNLTAAIHNRPPSTLSQDDMMEYLEAADAEIVAELSGEPYQRFVAAETARGSPALGELNRNLQVKFTEIAKLEEEKRRVALSSAGDRAQKAALLQTDIDTATQKLTDKGISAAEIGQGVDRARLALPQQNVDAKKTSHALERRMGVDSESAAPRVGSVAHALGSSVSSRPAAPANSNSVKVKK